MKKFSKERRKNKFSKERRNEQGEKKREEKRSLARKGETKDNFYEILPIKSYDSESFRIFNYESC